MDLPAVRDVVNVQSVTSEKRDDGKKGIEARPSELRREKLERKNKGNHRKGVKNFKKFPPAARYNALTNEE